MLTIHKATGLSPTLVPQTDRLPDGRWVRQAMLRGPITVHTGGRFQDGKEIATVTLHAGEREPQFNIKVSFEIAFDEGGPAKGEFASKCLRNLHDFVRDEVLASFEPIFPK
jgi:hypothetical protein